MSKTSLKPHLQHKRFSKSRKQVAIYNAHNCAITCHVNIFIFSEQTTSKDRRQTNFNQKMNGASSRPNGLPNTKYQVNFYIVLETTILRFVYRGYEDLEFMIKIFVSGLLS